MTLHLTTLDPKFDQQVANTRSGQAHWAGTGPDGTTCGECSYLGYWKRTYNASGDLTDTHKSGGCSEYRRLTGRHGPVIPLGTPSCKYFKPRNETSEIPHAVRPGARRA